MPNPADADVAASAVDAAQAEVLARQVVAHHGGTPDQVTVLAGVVNHVLRVQGPGTDWVVRTPVDPREPDEFPVERWATARASEVGIPSPRVVTTGSYDGRPYLVWEHVAETPGLPGSVWRWLGRYAALAGEIPCHDAPDGVFSRFGRDLPRAWRRHLDYNLGELGAGDRLLADGVYATADLPVLRGLVDGLGEVELRFGLAHGDLAPRNLLTRGPTAPPLLIDWGSATTGPTPWTDLQRVHQWVGEGLVTRAQLAELSAAAGLPLIPATERVLVAMSVLQHLDVARWALDQRPDLYPKYRDEGRRRLRQLLEG